MLEKKAYTHNCNIYPGYTMKKNIISILVVGLSSTPLFCYFSIPYLTAETVTFTVTDKDRIVTGSGEGVSSKYLVFTDIETFENTDSFLRLKFASSDLQGSLKVGETYTAEVYGWRVPVFSTYRNIVEVQ